MKKSTLFFSFALLLLSRLQAQDTLQYKSVFGENSTSFNILITFYEGGYLTDSVFYVKDTLVNGMMYKHFSLTEKHSNTSYPNIANFLLRENETHSKVFLRGIPGNRPPYLGNDANEYLVMDLNLNIGDTFHLQYGNNSASPVVSAIEIDEEGNKHIIFYEDDESLDPIMEFIEGTGTSSGLFYIGNIGPLLNGWYSLYLLCAYKDGVNTYLHWAGKCSHYSVGITPLEALENPIQLYPNPARDVLILDLGENEFQYKKVELLNLLGQIKQSLCITSAKQHIPVQTLPAGQYIVRITPKNGNAFYKKILITH